MVAIGTATREEWVALVGVMGRNDLLADADFMNPSWRIANNSKVDEVVNAWAEKQSTSDIGWRPNKFPAAGFALSVTSSPGLTCTNAGCWRSFGIAGLLPTKVRSLPHFP